jgi:hypothetical protein
LWQGTRDDSTPPLSSLEESILSDQNTIPISSLIKNVRFDFSEVHGDLGGALFEAGECIGDEVRMKETLTGVIKIIPRLLSKLTQTRSFEFGSTTYESSDYAPQLDLELWETINRKLVEGLMTSKLENLTDLRLSLPCAYDFVSIGESLPSIMFERLNTLYLGITDATGPDGSKDYLHWANEEENGDDHIPLSNLQKRHPNVDRLGQSDSEIDTDSKDDGDQRGNKFVPTSGNEVGFKVTSRCPNLETLGSSGTHLVDGNLLPKMLVSQNLTNLFLDRIKISAENLIRLLSPTTDTSLISGLMLENVELTAGTWAQVCKHLLQYPNLVYFHAEDLTYSETEIQST